MGWSKRENESLFFRKSYSNISGTCERLCSHFPVSSELVSALIRATYK